MNSSTREASEAVAVMRKLLRDAEAGKPTVTPLAVCDGTGPVGGVAVPGPRLRSPELHNQLGRRRPRRSVPTGA